MTNGFELRIAAILLIAALSATFVSPPLVKAAPPTQIVLNYNEDTQVLFVNVTHEVPNPGNHYVELIEIFKNSVFQFNRTYPDQEFNFGRNDTFSISASSGDNLTVTATCSRDNLLSGWIIVSASTTTTGSSTTSPTLTTTTEPITPPEPVEPLNPAVFIGVGLVAVVVFMVVLVLYKEGYISQLTQKVRS
ncbi:MAG: hypothetical protein ACXADC_12600 [Candidatus Thorarchaeota archaeon]|jgi:hypothetical protein